MADGTRVDDTSNDTDNKGPSEAQRNTLASIVEAAVDKALDKRINATTARQRTTGKTVDTEPEKGKSFFEMLGL